LEVSYAFGIWLKQRRKALDLTQAELAQRLGCATVTLQKIELDQRRPSKQLAERLAEVLDVQPAERPAFLQSARGGLVRERVIVATIGGEATRAVPCGRPASTIRPRHNLLAQSTSFIGREREINQVLTLLRREDVRLLTLTGAGGTGKTRISLRVAAEVLDAFTSSLPDGVWLVDLAPISDSAVVPSAIATVLGVREATGRPLRESLLAYLATKQMLLVLDNFEQVLGATPLVADLLTGAPRLKILVTSRSLLGVYGEQTFAVPTLGLPEPSDGDPEVMRLEQVAHTEAVALFLARARAANPDFALTPTNIPAVVGICQQLDGLPLAIELAAARSRLLTPQALVQRLIQRMPGRLHLLTGGPRTLPARQQTLRNTIDWSYDLLTPAEQVLFRRLAVFAGGCTLEAVEAVCTGDDIRPVDVLDGVASLGDKSLLRQGATPDGEPRFSMLETIREYALEHLVASGEAAALRERHARYELGWLEAMKV
jgi:predicted ATPase/DNA-binding XRE family transcriptional regulator